MPTSPSVVATQRRSPNRGVSKETETELLQDIEFYGGIDSACLAHVCDRKPYLYGEAGSSRRKKIQNKVNYWKRFDCQQYRKLLQRIKQDECGSAPTPSSTRTTPAEGETNSTTPHQTNCTSPPFPLQHPTPRELFPFSIPAMLSSTAMTALPPPTGAAGSQSASRNAMHIQRALEAEEYG